MESQILSSLVEIKVALYWLIAILSVGVFASSIRAGLALRSAVRREKADRVSREAGGLYDDGKLEEVLAYCDDELKTRPKDPYAMWYKAKALYQMKDYENAEELLRRISITAPTWDEGHVQPFLRMIASLRSPPD